MTLHMEKIPEVCPICGEELKFTEQESVGHGSGRGPRVSSCPNCNFRLEFPHGNAEDDEELMKRENEKEPNEYAVAENETAPSEDAMSAYYW
ncbi:MAG: hypothetical protein VB071_09375 [Lawsonibacter sp.]|nr:hypothetical protein [Lawsonibacter sp.]